MIHERMQQVAKNLNAVNIDTQLDFDINSFLEVGTKRSSSDQNPLVENYFENKRQRKSNDISSSSFGEDHNQVQMSELSLLPLATVISTYEEESRKETPLFMSEDNNFSPEDSLNCPNESSLSDYLDQILPPMTKV